VRLTPKLKNRYHPLGGDSFSFFFGTSASRSSRNYVLLLEKRHFSHRVEDGRSKSGMAVAKL
jgi:hypothetical protein